MVYKRVVVSRHGSSEVLQGVEAELLQPQALLALASGIGLNRSLGYSWKRILSDYNLLKGGLLPLGLVILT